MVGTKSIDIRAVKTDDFDAVIDVRSPAEFAEDHVPGAINCPVLDDAERADIGTIYKQVFVRDDLSAQSLGSLADEILSRLGMVLP